MAKQNPYKIGAPTDKPNNFPRKEQFNSNRNPRQNNYQNKSRDFSQNREGSRDRGQNFNKSRPIRKDFKPRDNRPQRSDRPQKSDRPQRSDRPNTQRRDNRSFKPQNRKFENRRDYSNVKREQNDHKNKKQFNEQKVDTNNSKIEDKNPKVKQQKIKHNRIIIRNLVFDISVDHLKKLLSPFGQIEDVHIPLNPDGKGSRGFAFIEFKNRNNALKAIKELNGTKYKGRQIVLDESISKQKYLQNRIDEEEKQNGEQKNTDQKQNSNLKIQQVKKEKTQIKNEMDQEDEQDQADEEEQNNQEQVSDAEEENEVKEQTTKEKRQKTESQIIQDISSEVFIRNLPITVDEKTLHQFFRRYGKLKFAKVVVNKETGLSKGSAFLKFDDPIKAKELVEYSRSYEMNLLGKNPNFKINPAINFQLEGIVLKLFPVESRQNITEKVKGRQEKDLKRQQQKKDEKKKKPIKKIRSIEKLVEYDPNNKRNLKLALLGINQITDQMKQKDQQRFKNHQKEKIQKLKNPNNAVSDKRIVLKYLNKDITEQDIRNICQDYLKETSQKANSITYCKLMLESLETKKSAGFAFVEFKTHQVALAFLQWIAKSPKKLMNDPFICEFAIQDSRKLQKLQNKNNRPKPATNDKPKPTRSDKTKPIKKDRSKSKRK